MGKRSGNRGSKVKNNIKTILIQARRDKGGLSCVYYYGDCKNKNATICVFGPKQVKIHRPAERTAEDRCTGRLSPEPLEHKAHRQIVAAGGKDGGSVV